LTYQADCGIIDTMYELTIFKNQFDNKTHRTVSVKTWDEFDELLFGLSSQKGEKGGRNSSPLITPAMFQEGTTRSNKSVTHWGNWCCVDVDDYEFDNATVDTTDVRSLKNELVNRFGRWSFICYSTASSSVSQPKFRLVFDLNDSIPQDRIKHFWYALNKELGDIGDPQTKDLARMYYVPADYPNAYNFYFKHDGDPINTDELMARHKYEVKSGNSFIDRLPPEMQKAVIEHRKNQLDNTNFSWSSYHDCPFFPKHLGVEYRAITGTGWYHKMYQIMVAIAGHAISKGYPITATQIAEMCKQFDAETGNWYENRPLQKEADRALEYVYRNG